MRKLITLPLLCLLLGVSPSYGDSLETRIIPLEHRSASQIARLIAPYSSDRTTITAGRNRLILRSSRDELDELATLIARLDTPLKQYLVSVRSRGNDSQQYGAASGSLRVGKISVDGRPLPSHWDATGSSPAVRYRDSNGALVIQNSTTSSRSHNQQSLRVLEGKPAYISSGVEIPLRSTYRDHYGRRHDSVDYHPVEKGFYLTISPSGEQVRLGISTRNDEVSHGQINTEGTSSTVRAPLNTWIPLGAIQQGDNDKHRGILHTSSSGQSRHSTIEIKITEQ